MVRLFFRLLSFGSWLRGPSLTTGFGLFRVRHPLRVLCCSFVSSSPAGTQHSTCRVGDLPGAEGCPLSALFVSCVLIQLTQRGPFSIPSTFWGFILLWQLSSRNGSLLWELGIWKSVGVLPESKQQKERLQCLRIYWDLVQRRQAVLGRVGHFGFPQEQGCCFPLRERRNPCVITFAGQQRTCK